MSTALAVKDETGMMAPAGMGEKQAIAEIRNRIVEMMPGAVTAPKSVQWAAAQLAVMHKLNPFNGEIYILPLGSKKVGNKWEEQYCAHVGIKGLRKLARRKAEFMTEERVMAPEEVRTHRRDLYDENDIGIEVTLYHLGVAQKCASIGIPYKPIRAVGFWREKAKYHNKNKKWMPDNIPNTWSAQMVAEKRAEINAIKRAFDMEIDVADPSADHAVEELNYEVQKMDRDRALIADRRPVYEDDGEMLFATPKDKRNPVVAEEIEEDYTEYEEVADPNEEQQGQTNTANGPCPVCGAPEGKPHATKCDA